MASVRSREEACPLHLSEQVKGVWLPFLSVPVKGAWPLYMSDTSNAVLKVKSSHSELMDELMSVSHFRLLITYNNCMNFPK